MIRHGRANREDVFDLTQEVFRLLFDRDARVLRAWDPRKGASLRNYVGLVAQREAGHILRSGRRSGWAETPTAPDDFDVASMPTQEQKVGSRQTLELLFGRLEDRLSTKGMLIFRALFVEQRTVAEVGFDFDLSADAVYAWRSRLNKVVKSIASEISTDSAMSPPMNEGRRVHR